MNWDHIIFYQSLKDWMWNQEMDLPNGTTWFTVHHLRKGYNHPAVQVQRYAEPVLLVCALNVAFECVCTDSRHQKRNGWILLSLKGEVTYIRTYIYIYNILLRSFFVENWFFCQIPSEGCVESELMHVWRCQHSKLSYSMQTYRSGMKIAVLSWRLYVYFEVWSTHFEVLLSMAPTINCFRILSASPWSEWLNCIKTLEKIQLTSFLHVDIFKYVIHENSLKSDKDVDLLFCWLWKVMGSHHFPRNLQYECYFRM